ncbi:MAG: hypothetical protein WCT31_00570 [Candidatus Micrarchaeia archaeon]|jgi:tRNA splicing endonuclease
MKSILIEDVETIKKLHRIGAIPEILESIEIHPLLAAYLEEKGVLDKKGYLKMAKKADKLAEDKLAVVRHLWNHGYVCRFNIEGDDYIRVHRKGVRPGEDRTNYVLKVIPKKWKTNLPEIVESMDFAGKLRKELIYARVEDEKVQFFRVGRTTFE